MPFKTSFWLKLHTKIIDIWLEICKYTYYAKEHLSAAHKDLMRAHGRWAVPSTIYVRGKGLDMFWGL